MSRVIVIACRIGTPEDISVPNVRAKRETVTIWTNEPTFGSLKTMRSITAFVFAFRKRKRMPKMAPTMTRIVRIQCWLSVSPRSMTNFVSGGIVPPCEEIIFWKEGTTKVSSTHTMMNATESTTTG